MDKIQKYIQENYNAKLNRKEIEDIACYSIRNIERIYRKCFNESIGHFQKRLKLENAFKKLIFTSQSIGDIAFEVGYLNQSSFTKAFKKQFSNSPTTVRNKKESFLKELLGKRTLEKLSYEQIFIPKKKIYYKSIVVEDYEAAAIEELWDSINRDVVALEKNLYFGLILDEPLITLPYKSRYQAAIDIAPNNPKSYLIKSIFGKRYLKFIHIGSYDNLADTYFKIFKFWFYQLNIELDNSEIIEQYIVAKIDIQKQQTHIFLPIK
jgi:AraC family transcriptional regulator